MLQTYFDSYQAVDRLQSKLLLEAEQACVARLERLTVQQMELMSFRSHLLGLAHADVGTL